MGLPLRIALCTAVCISWCTRAAADPPVTRFSGLAPAPDGASTYAAAVSADGSTVVGQLAYVDGRVEAFRWRMFGDFEILGDLPGGLHFTTATAVSEDGSVVAGTGYRGDDSRPEDGVQVAWTYTTAGGFVELPDLAGGSVLANASGISWDGSVVVGSSYDARDDFVAVRWTNGVAEALGTLDSSTPRSDARGVSYDGTVVVGGSPFGQGPTPRTHSFVVRGSAAPADIGDLDGGADFTSVAAVSADGNVLVGSAASAASTDGYLEAFRKVGDGPLVPLGFLFSGEGSGPFASDALAANHDGSVVVGRSVVDADENEVAFYWTAHPGMRPLNDIAVSAGIELPADVVLAQATGVSADGFTVVGNAWTGTQVQAYALQLPEPSGGSCFDLCGPGPSPLDMLCTCARAARTRSLDVAAMALGLIVLLRGARRRRA